MSLIELFIGLGVGLLMAIIVFLVGRKHLSEQKKTYESMLSDAKSSCESQISALRDGYEGQLSTVKEGHAAQLNSVKEDNERHLNEIKAGYEKRIEEIKSEKDAALEQTRKSYDDALAETKKNYETSLSDMKSSHEKALSQQVAAIKAEMTSRTEEILKAREAELDKKAEETFKNLAGPLGKELSDMKQSFEESKKANTESSAQLKTHLETAVKHLLDQTENIGEKADNLANALRGRNKMQGCFGETILENILEKEGFREGVQYDREVTLRDEMGKVIINEDSGNKMRPDVIVHFPDDTDVIVDSKVDLKALSDWYEAKTDEQRQDAEQRNLQAIKAQIDNLSKKDYSRYLSKNRKSLDYVVMFVPIYNSFQLAKTIEPSIWRDAYSKNVLITTEETLVPFLRMILIAWRNMEQATNQQNIIKAAEEMLARVSDMAAAHAKLGDKLQAVQKEYEACDKKLKDSGQSIIVSANKVISYGVKTRANKPLPALYGHEIEDTTSTSEANLAEQ